MLSDAQNDKSGQGVQNLSILACHCALKCLGRVPFCTGCQPLTCIVERQKQEGDFLGLSLPRPGYKMEKALTRVGSFWISKKAKEEISNIGEDLSTFSNAVEEKAKWLFNKLKGKPQKSLPDLLREHGLPPGLFPKNILCYEFDESKYKLIVYLPSACEVSFKDQSVLRYATRVKGILMRGKLTGVEGMKTKVLMWVKVTQVGVESCKADKVCFTAGVKKLRPKDAYEMPREAIKVEEF